jgi:tetratricopeptide (TPR) repeat protein
MKVINVLTFLCEVPNKEVHGEGKRGRKRKREENLCDRAQRTAVSRCFDERLGEADERERVPEVVTGIESRGSCGKENCSMKNQFAALSLAVAIIFAGLVAKAPAIMIRKLNGTTVEVSALFGTVTHVDQNRRSFTLHWQLKGLLPMEHYYPSYEDTYRVTEGTVYKNGSWANVKNGAYVRITGHSDVADTVEFTASAGAQKDAAVLNQQGIAKQNKGDWDGAMADYNQAIRLDPNYSAAYDNRGNVKRQKGDLNGAMADIDQAIQLNPKNALAYNNRGKVKEAKGDLNGAIADFSQAISLNPKYALAYRNRGNVKRKKGDINGANADFSEAIKLGAKSFSAR